MGVALARLSARLGGTLHVSVTASCAKAGVSSAYHGAYECVCRPRSIKDGGTNTRLALTPLGWVILCNLSPVLKAWYEVPGYRYDDISSSLDDE